MFATNASPDVSTLRLYLEKWWLVVTFAAYKRLSLLENSSIEFSNKLGIDD
jgi:hypothetical protein